MIFFRVIKFNILSKDTRARSVNPTYCYTSNIITKRINVITHFCNLLLEIFYFIIPSSLWERLRDVIN